MSFDADRLYKLLPAEHRARDERLGYPLKQLVEVIAGQVAVVEEGIEQLYDNLFVETAAPWALPYIADLLGIRGLSGSGARVRAPRSEVGHTIAYRRRKGTASMLELLARDATGWPARAVEFFQRLATTQHLNHVRHDNIAVTSLRNADQLEFFNTPFEAAARTIEVRRIEPLRGKWNIPNVGLFLWRLVAYRLTRTPLVPAQGFVDRRHFRMHPLGFDVQLFSLPETEEEFSHLAEPINVPMPISRRMLKGEPLDGKRRQFFPSASYYGDGKSLLLEDVSFTSISAAEILVADLRDDFDNLGNRTWGHEKFGADKWILLDPVLGRVLFPKDRPADDVVYATFHYGFSGDIGGGEYNRPRSRRDAPTTVTVSRKNPLHNTIEKGIDAVLATGGVVQVAESDRFAETIGAINVGGNSIEIRAARQRRPTLVLGNTLEITGGANGGVTLDGLLIAGKPIRVSGELGRLTLKHCTILPSLTIGDDGTVTMGPGPALEIESDTTVVRIESCILQSIQVRTDTRIQMRNSMIDASDATAVALSGTDGKSLAGSWKIVNCTIRGQVNIATLELASNTIFSSESTVANHPAVKVERRQEGCVRFCALPRDSRVPRRYQCVPREDGPNTGPSFTSLQYAHAPYGQLSQRCPEAIRRGADDESEMGAFHDLYQPQRLAHLRARLGEYLRFGMEAGVFCVT